MAVDFPARNAVFTKHFGSEVDYTPAGGAAAPITGVLEGGDDFEQRTPGAQYSLFVDLADLTPAKGATVTIASITGYTNGNYRVIEVRPDGDNAAYLDLQFIRT